MNPSRKLTRRRQVKAFVREQERQRLQELSDAMNLGHSLSMDEVLQVSKAIKKMKKKSKK